MIIMGLTGSIAMGKSVIASFLLLQNIPVFDSDRFVRHLLEHDANVISQIAQNFPFAMYCGQVNRTVLFEYVFSHINQLRLLQKIIHPRVIAGMKSFVRCERRRGVKLVVLDIPLLYETGCKKLCDLVILASAPKFLQRQRALARPMMSEQKFKMILRRQLSDHKKRIKADLIVYTGKSKAAVYQQIRAIIKNYA
jgi:dephospho-CoA kinase